MKRVFCILVLTTFIIFSCKNEKAEPMDETPAGVRLQRVQQSKHLQVNDFLNLNNII